MEEALGAEVAAVTEGEEAFVVLEGERRERGTEAELAERAGADRQLGAAAAGETRVVQHAKPDQPTAFAEGVDRPDPAVEGEIETAALQEDAAPQLSGSGVAGGSHGDEALGDAAARGLGRDEERAEVAAKADAADRGQDLEPERSDADVADEVAALVDGVQLGTEGPLRSGSAGSAGSEPRSGGDGDRTGIELDLGDPQGQAADQRDGHFDVGRPAHFGERAQALLALSLPDGEVAADGGTVAALDALHVPGDLRMQHLRVGLGSPPGRSLDGEGAPDALLAKLRRPEDLRSRERGSATQEPHRLRVVAFALGEMGGELQQARIVRTACACARAAQERPGFVEIAARDRGIDRSPQRVAVVWNGAKHLEVERVGAVGVAILLACPSQSAEQKRIARIVAQRRLQRCLCAPEVALVPLPVREPHRMPHPQLTERPPLGGRERRILLQSAQDLPEECVVACVEQGGSQLQARGARRRWSACHRVPHQLHGFGSVAQFRPGDRELRDQLGLTPRLGLQRLQLANSLLAPAGDRKLERRRDPHLELQAPPQRQDGGIARWRRQRSEDRQRLHVLTARGEHPRLGDARFRQLGGGAEQSGERVLRLRKGIQLQQDVC